MFRTLLPNDEPVWLLARYSDVRRLLTDDNFVKNRLKVMSETQRERQPWTPKMFRALERNMLDLDPPDHTRLKKLVQKVFTPLRVREMEERVTSLAEELLAKGSIGGSLDVVRDFALPLPLTIITEILGVPKEDQHKFHRWTQAVVSLDQFNPSIRALPSVWLFVRYLRRFFDQRRREPRDDLVSALIQAEEEGDQLSEDELLAMVFLILVAGHETTVNLISSGMLALLQNPDQLTRLRESPELIDPAVEELLRFTSPVFLSTERYAIDDLELHGRTIPQGAMILGIIGSANRDENVFDRPYELDVSRTPNKHLSFGHGTHFCLGAPLARLETTIALRCLLQQFSRIDLSTPPEDLRWRRSLVLRGLEELPISVQ